LFRGLCLATGVYAIIISPFLLAAYLVYSSALKMKAICFSEISVSLYHTIWSHILEEGSLRREVSWTAKRLKVSVEWLRTVKLVDVSNIATLGHNGSAGGQNSCFTLHQSEERVQTVSVSYVESQLTTAPWKEMRETKLNMVLQSKKNVKNKRKFCGWLVYTRLCEFLFKYYPNFSMLGEAPAICHPGLEMFPYHDWHASKAKCQFYEGINRAYGVGNFSY
jgi:hypothetical protein